MPMTVTMADVTDLADFANSRPTVPERVVERTR